MQRKLFTNSITSARRAVWTVGLGVLTLALFVRVSGGATTEPRPSGTAPAPGLIVHEWGTFVSMQGSDGVTLDGLHHEEADLPSFVFSRSRDQIRHLPAPRSKLETPVIYFYAPGPMTVNVRVTFPRGLFTQWFPDVTMSGPRMQQTDLLLKDGLLQWTNVQLSPSFREDDLGNRHALKPPASVPPITDGNHYAAARAVDANWVSARGQADKFLFYRGVGQFEPLLDARVDPQAESMVRIRNLGQLPLTRLLVMRVEENGMSAYEQVELLQGGELKEVRIRPHEPRSTAASARQRLCDQLATNLIDSGLYAKEALAMVNTWEQSYFQTPGVRVLYVVPHEVVERALPLTIEPAPAESVRVIVGRLELLTPERERAAGAAVRDLTAGDSSRRASAFAELLKMGRFAEPVLRRVAQTAPDDELRARCRQLLLAESLQAIRTAAQLPVPDRLSMQARLASTYRHLGMKPEARSMGEAVLAELRNKPEPAADQHVELRRYLRARSLAHDAVGDDARALETTTQTIRFAARINDRACQSCHNVTKAPPRGIADLRDWWGRSKFIELAQRTGRAAELRKGFLAQILATADRGADVRTLTAEDRAVRLLYVYLSEASGPPSETALVSPQALWKRLLVLDEMAPTATGVANASAVGARRESR